MTRGLTVGSGRRSRAGEGVLWLGLVGRDRRDRIGEGIRKGVLEPLPEVFWRALKGTQSICFLCCGNSEPLKALEWWHDAQEWMERRTTMKWSEGPWPQGCGLQLLSGVRLETQSGARQS